MNIMFMFAETCLTKLNLEDFLHFISVRYSLHKILKLQLVFLIFNLL